MRAHRAEFGLDAGDLDGLRARALLPLRQRRGPPAVGAVLPRHPGLRPGPARQRRRGRPADQRRRAARSRIRRSPRSSRACRRSTRCWPPAARPAPRSCRAGRPAAAGRRARHDVRRRPAGQPDGVRRPARLAGAAARRPARTSTTPWSTPTAARRSTASTWCGRPPRCAFDNYPGAPLGGAQAAKVLRDRRGPWLTARRQRLFGDNAHVYSDPERRHRRLPAARSGPGARPRDRARPAPGAWSYTQDVAPADIRGQDCPPPWAAPGTTSTRASAGATTAHRPARSSSTSSTLPRPPARRARHRLRRQLRQLRGRRPRERPGRRRRRHGRLPTDFPACTGGPTAGHTNNAFVIPVPDGTPLLMQIYLWSSFCTGGSDVYDVNPADDALVVYHEYTHGMTNRLVTDAAGLPGDERGPAGRHGRGLRRLVRPRHAQRAGLRAGLGARRASCARASTRTTRCARQAFDCPVGASAAGLSRDAGGGPGGYTYGDFAKILGGAEVHADGEIWVETLWDLRTRLIADHGAGDGDHPHPGAGHRRAAARAGQPDLPRHAQRDPAGRPEPRLRRSRPHLGGVRRARDGLPRVDHRQQRHVAGPGLLAAPSQTHADAATGAVRVGDRTRPVGPRSCRSRSKRFKVGQGTTFSFRALRGRDRAHRDRARRGRAAAWAALPRPPSGRCATARAARATCGVGSAGASRNLRPGAQRVPFSGRIGSRALRPGRYRATIVATDAGRQPLARRAGLTFRSFAADRTLARVEDWLTAAARGPPRPSRPSRPTTGRSPTRSWTSAPTGRARELAAAGVGAGDRVGVTHPPGLAFAELLHALPRLGAVLEPGPPTEPPAARRRGRAGAGRAPRRLRPRRGPLRDPHLRHHRRAPKPVELTYANHARQRGRLGRRARRGARRPLALPAAAAPRRRAERADPQRHQPHHGGAAPALRRRPREGDARGGRGDARLAGADDARPPARRGAARGARAARDRPRRRPVAGRAARLGAARRASRSCPSTG